MKLKRILTLTAPLLLCASAAWAATSGVAQIDGPLNTMGRVVQAGGYIVGGVGTVGVIHHIRSGSWLGMLEHLGLTVVGASAVVNYSAMAPSFGGTAAALIHSALTHPAAHLAIHTATRLVS